MVKWRSWPKYVYFNLRFSLACIIFVSLLFMFYFFVLSWLAGAVSEIIYKGWTKGKKTLYNKGMLSGTDLNTDWIPIWTLLSKFDVKNIRRIRTSNRKCLKISGGVARHVKPLQILLLDNNVSQKKLIPLHLYILPTPTINHSLQNQVNWGQHSCARFFSVPIYPRLQSLPPLMKFPFPLNLPLWSFPTPFRDDPQQHFCWRPSQYMWPEHPV